LLLYGGVFGRFTGYWDKLDKIIDWHCAAGWLIRDSICFEEGLAGRVSVHKNYFIFYFFLFQFNVS
jgi:hypothetical protein